MTAYAALIRAVNVSGTGKLPKEDLKAIEVPVLVMHSKDDQIVPYEDAGPLAVKLLKNGTLKTYEGLPHGMMTTHPEIINGDLLAFIRGQHIATAQPHDSEGAVPA